MSRSPAARLNAMKLVRNRANNAEVLRARARNLAMVMAAIAIASTDDDQAPDAHNEEATS